MDGSTASSFTPKRVERKRAEQAAAKLTPGAAGTSADNGELERLRRKEEQMREDLKQLRRKEEQLREDITQLRRKEERLSGELREERLRSQEERAGSSGGANGLLVTASLSSAFPTKFEGVPPGFWNRASCLVTRPL